MQLDHDFHDFIEPFPIVFPLIFQQVVILDLPLDQIAHILEVLTGCKGFSGFKLVPAPGHVFVLVGVNRQDFVQPAYGRGIRAAACIVSRFLLLHRIHPIQAFGKVNGFGMDGMDGR